MSNSNKEKYNKILGHPVIKLFLTQKWDKVKGFHNIIIRMHLLFSFIFTWYILWRFTSDDCWSYNQENEKFSFMYILFCIIFTFYVILIGIDLFNGIKKKKSKRIFYKLMFESYPFISSLIILILNNKALYGVIIGYVIIFTLTEIIQLSISPTIYVKSFRNYLDLVTITGTFIILFDTNGDLMQ